MTVLSDVNNSERNVVTFLPFPLGQFANTVFQFLFSVYIQKSLQCGVRYVSDQSLDLVHRARYEKIFGIKILQCDELDDSKLNEMIFLNTGIGRSVSPEIIVERLRGIMFANPARGVVISDYFQFDTGFIYALPDYEEAFRNYLLPDSEQLNTDFQREMREKQAYLINKIQGQFLISIHIRRKDYLYHSEKHFISLDLKSSLDRVRYFIKLHRLTNAIIYISSDDLEFCLPILDESNLRYLSRFSLPILETVKDRALDEILWDLCACSLANFMLNSNSSFSTLAALINNRGRIFGRVSPEGTIEYYDPRNSPVILGL